MTIRTEEATDDESMRNRCGGSMKEKIIRNWYFILIGLFFLCAGAVYLWFGESSYIAVHDNLDLFVAQFQMMKNTDSFFAHGVDVPFLGGVSRDNLPSELSLYTLLYALLPSFWAYVAGYFLKIGIAVISVWLLAKDWYGVRFEDYKPIVALMGFAYGALNMFPAFGIPFASIPLALYLLRRIYKEPNRWLYAALFVYPFFSYFSYFGFFILAYLTVAVVWLSIRDKKIAKSLLGALFVLGVGYVVFEYRLFGVMLFSAVETIRSSMVEASLSAKEIAAQAFEVWKSGMFHAESVHDKFVLWVCMAYFLYLNGKYIIQRNGKAIFHDMYNLFLLVIVFNSVIYGIYNWGSFRSLIETILPPLKGFQFNRTVFFSPFLWYGAFFLLLQRMYAAARGQEWFAKWMKPAANVLALMAIAVILLTPSRYNDLLATCKNQALHMIKGKEIDAMNYEEFYSTHLFETIKEEIDYDGEWAAAYGIHPAVLEYNGIATLDGYLGFYPQQYKEDFRKIIAPALERVEESRIYYDDWGARAYLYSGTDASVVSATKSFSVTDNSIYIDAQAFENLGGTYIFSRIEFDNAQEAGLTFVDAYAAEGAPYEIYLYRR